MLHLVYFLCVQISVVLIQSNGLLQLSVFISLLHFRFNLVPQILIWDASQELFSHPFFVVPDYQINEALAPVFSEVSKHLLPLQSLAVFVNLLFLSIISRVLRPRPHILLSFGVAKSLFFVSDIYLNRLTLVQLTPLELTIVGHIIDLGFLQHLLILNFLRNLE